MKKNKTGVLVWIVVILVVLVLAACGIYAYNAYQEKLAEEARQAEIAAFYARPDIELVVTDQDIDQLDLYTNLHSVDLTGSTCYSAIAKFISTHPSVKVTYTVDLGGPEFGCDVTELELAAGSFDLDTLTENLQYLPQVTSLKLPLTDLTAEQIAALREAYSGITVEYTVDVLGQEVTEDVTEMNLSSMTGEEIETLTAMLPMVPQLNTLDLMAEDGTSAMSMTDVKALMDACPEMTILYSFDFYGTTLSTATETVELNKVKIGNEGEELIRQALDIMPACTYFKLDDCGIDSVVMASIRDDYPETKVVWRVFFGKFNCLTDTEMLRITNGLTDDIVGELIYCNDVKYMDAGHDEELTDISWIAYMPKLEICILSGSPITDLSCFQDHQNIEFLELCFCGYIKDLSPLANCPNLKYLNISYTAVKDLSPLDNLPLERFNCMKTKVSSTEENRFLELHPSDVCLTRFSGTQCYGYGWRYVDDGITFWDYYANMREIFMYDNGSYVSGREYQR